MNELTDEAYYRRADHLLSEGAAIWDEMVRKITYELAVSERPKPIFDRIVDLRETTPQAALLKLQKHNPFLVWKDEMWLAFREQRRAAAYVNFNQALVEISNASHVGLYIFSLSENYDDLRDKIYALSDEMGKANVHKE
jgi:hypothetical protein